MTRTALKRNGLAEFRCAPYGSALKRFRTRRAKPAASISIKIPKKSLIFWEKYDKI